MESFLNDLKLPHTIFRPVSLMEGTKKLFFYKIDLYELIMNKHYCSLKNVVPKKSSIQLVSASDVAKLVEQALASPATFMNKQATLVADCLDMKQVRCDYEQATGEKLSTFKMPSFVVFQASNSGSSNEILDKFKLFQLCGYSGAVAEQSGLQTWRQFLTNKKQSDVKE